MMSWNGNQYFAPESFLTNDGRRDMWAWLVSGNLRKPKLNELLLKPSGVQSLPRELELPEDSVLRIKPFRELQLLRYDKIALQDSELETDSLVELRQITGDALELNVTFSSPRPQYAPFNYIQTAMAREV